MSSDTTRGLEPVPDELTPSTKLVYLILSTDPETPLTMTELADRSGLAVRTVRRAINALLDEDLVRAEVRDARSQTLAYCTRPPDTLHACRT